MCVCKVCFHSIYHGQSHIPHRRGKRCEAARIFMMSHSHFGVFRVDFIIWRDEGSWSWCHSRCTRRCPETAAPCERGTRCSSSSWGGRGEKTLSLSALNYTDKVTEPPGGHNRAFNSHISFLRGGWDQNRDNLSIRYWNIWLILYRTFALNTFLMSYCVFCMSCEVFSV